MHHSWDTIVASSLKSTDYLPDQLQVFPLHLLDSKPCRVTMASKKLAAPAEWWFQMLGQIELKAPPRICREQGQNHEAASYRSTTAEPPATPSTRCPVSTGR